MHGIGTDGFPMDASFDRLMARDHAQSATLHHPSPARHKRRFQALVASSPAINIR
jgi:hypothetical protein